MTNDLHFWSDRAGYDAAVASYDRRSSHPVRLLDRIPGKRTARDLVVAAIPARLLVVMALFAFWAAVAISVAAKAFAWLGLSWLATKSAQYAATFEAMPLWVLIGGSMAQVAARVCVAWDDVARWWCE